MTNLSTDPVFPREPKYANAWGTIEREGARGLTKRELFAAMAMQGLYTANGFPVFSRQDEITHDGDGCFTSRTERMKEAALAADALLTALKETP